ncbi:hypothetical protein HY971_00075 [Candidatus Kaiserbacteria bacterium]|nr:hypothetical protein [Candidatus Kaiserbacteria bacterium]
MVDKTLLPASAGIGSNYPDPEPLRPDPVPELPQTKAVNNDGSGGQQLTQPAKGLVATQPKGSGVSGRFSGF